MFFSSSRELSDVGSDLPPRETEGLREYGKIPLDAMTYERWPVRREDKESVRVRSHPVSCGCTGVGAGAEVDAFGRMYVNLSRVDWGLDFLHFVSC
jgi:hypothetical protein